MEHKRSLYSISLLGKVSEEEREYLMKSPCSFVKGDLYVLCEEECGV
jgi:hypothetical protein